MNPFDIFYQKLISSSKKTSRSDPEEQTQHFKSSKTIPWFRHHQRNTGLRTQLFCFCLQRALHTRTRLKFQFRVVSHLKSPSNYLELIYGIDFLLELLQYHDKTFSFPQQVYFFPEFYCKN